MKRIAIFLCAILTISCASAQSYSSGSRDNFEIEGGTGNAIKKVKEKIPGAWFANVVYKLNIAINGEKYSSLGAMGGYIGNWGGYAKITFPIGDPSDGMKITIPEIKLGAIKRLSRVFHLYAGIGLSDSYYFHYDRYTDTHWQRSGGFGVDVGTLLRFNHWIANLGYSVTFADVYTNHGIQVGFGYCF